MRERREEEDASTEEMKCVSEGKKEGRKKIRKEKGKKEREESIAMLVFITMMSQR